MTSTLHLSHTTTQVGGTIGGERKRGPLLKLGALELQLGGKPKADTIYDFMKMAVRKSGFWMPPAFPFP